MNDWARDFARNTHQPGRSMKKVLILLAFLAFHATAAHAGTDRNRVLFISSYHPAFPSFMDQVNGIQTSLKDVGYAPEATLLDIEFMDTKRFDKTDRARRFGEALRGKLRHLPPYDAIIVGDDNALEFALKEQNGLFRDIPIVFLGVNNIARALAQDENPQVTGVVEAVSNDETIALIARLFPDAPGIYVVIDEMTPTGKSNTRNTISSAAGFPDLNISFLSTADYGFADLWRHIGSLPDTAPILMGGVFRDRNGLTQEYIEVVQQLRAATSAPLFSVQPHGIGHGVLGGHVVSHYEQGRAAGRMAADILKGHPVETIRVLRSSPNIYMFDHAELRRFGIDSASLPAEAVIRNLPQRSPFETYVDWIVAGAVALVVQMLLIVYLIQLHRHRNAAETAMRETQERLQAFLDNSPSVMLVKDREHRIVMANARYLSLHNVTLDEIVGVRGGTKLSEAERTRMEAADQRVMESGEATSETLRLPQPDCRSIYYNVSKFPVLNADGDVVGIGTINTDITELHEREEQLRQARAEAEVIAVQAQIANEAKSDFLASMSHEIRTPLNGVLGMATMLMDSPLNDEQKAQVETIRASGGLLLSLLNDILDLSKIEAGKMELENIDFDLRELLKSVSALWAPKAFAAGVEFAENLNAIDTPVLRSDPTRISQILFNFLSNALKFTEAGSVTLTVAQHAADSGGIVTRFEVRDTGSGIDDEALPNLFRKFTQADTSVTRKHGGTGLGLAISKQLAEAMGGDIGAESRPGEGSTFWFTIECPEGELADTDGTEAPTESYDEAEFRQLRILVAEDNDVNQKVIAALLGKNGHHIDIVGNGIEAVSAVVRGHYDVVLMDVQMPEMDGVTATRRIRELQGPQSGVPIIALTANAMKGDAERYKSAGMSDYVSKPIEREKLQAAVLRQCGTRLDATPVQQPSQDKSPSTPVDPKLREDLDAFISNLDREIG